MDIKKYIKPTTIIIIIAFLIIGLYALTEVNYFSYKQVAESNDVNASVVVIPSVGVFEKINNVSISQGVYIDVTSNIPTKGDTVLYGHRTLQGSPRSYLQKRCPLRPFRCTCRPCNQPRRFCRRS